MISKHLNAIPDSQKSWHNYSGKNVKPITPTVALEIIADKYRYLLLGTKSVYNIHSRMLITHTHTHTLYVYRKIIIISARYCFSPPPPPRPRRITHQFVFDIRSRVWPCRFIIIVFLYISVCTAADKLEFLTGEYVVVVVAVAAAYRNVGQVEINRGEKNKKVL